MKLIAPAKLKKAFKYAVVLFSFNTIALDNTWAQVFEPGRGVCYTIAVTAARTTFGSFLWKPVSESNGKLVVLFPSTSKSTGGTIYYGSTSIKGQYVARTNGDRPTVRWPLPGAFYPNGLKVCDNDIPAPKPKPKNKSTVPSTQLLIL